MSNSHLLNAAVRHPVEIKLIEARAPFDYLRRPVGACLARTARKRPAASNQVFGVISHVMHSGLAVWASCPGRNLVKSPSANVLHAGLRVNRDGGVNAYQRNSEKEF